jgi:DNA-binding LacI/PurR family transcriptional regulator
MRRLFSSTERPSAILSSMSSLSLMALSTLKELGLRCPEDVALVGFDDHPWAAVSDPPLTVVRQPARQLGRTAAQILLNLIGGDEPPETSVTLDCELVVRESC